MAHNVMLDALRPKLLGLVAQGAALTELPHDTVKGTLREALVKDLIEPFLPHSVVVRSGMIVTLSGSRIYRNQDDLFLFDRQKAPLLIESGTGMTIAPLEGVLAHIEVKSELRRQDVVKAIQAATELREMASGEAPAGLIFAYRSDLTEQSEVTRLISVLDEVGFQARPDQARSPIQLICIVDRGTWLLTRNPIGGLEGWWFVEHKEARHLFTFASLISNACFLRTSGAHGVGSYLFDPSWMVGPDPPCPVPSPPS